MSDGATRQQSGIGSGTAWAIGLLTALLFYILSPAPILKILESFEETDLATKLMEFFDLFYLPLDFLANRSEVVQTFYDWYFDVWGVAFLVP